MVNHSQIPAARFAVSGHHEEGLPAAEDGQGAEPPEAQHHPQRLPAPVHPVRPQGGVSGPAREGLHPGVGGAGAPEPLPGRVGADPGEGTPSLWMFQHGQFS